MVEFPNSKWSDYELLDSGNGMKLERFGAYVLSRPEPKALWTPSMSEEQWRAKAHTVFHPGAGFGKAGKEDTGVWEKLHKMEEQWQIRYNPEATSPKITLRLGMTAFKHVGVFPEQAPNWEYIYNKVKEIGGTPKVLNLFAYTGGATLAAAAAGAEVTHLDSVRQVVNWASDNAERSSLKNIHWVVEDAMKFVAREARRGHKYNGIILDPPAYGHGPDGERWKLDECLFGMLKAVGSILDSSTSCFMVLNLYSNGYSPLLGETVVREAIGLKPGTYRMESGELALTDKFGKNLPLSIYVRLEK